MSQRSLTQMHLAVHRPQRPALRGAVFGGARVSSAPHTPGRPSAPAYGIGLHAMTASSLVSAYLLVVLGSTVRVTNSGMGCISWPFCNGHLGLSGSYQALLEQSHRYLAAVVTILVVATFAAAWRWARRDRLVFLSAATALGLIGVQVLLGAITVWLQNAGWTVALHLAGAWLLVGAVTVTAVGVWWAPTASAPDGPVRRTAPAGNVGLAAVAALFGLSVTGMLVLNVGTASTACPGWPVCGRGTGPVGLVVLQYLHRSFALLATAIIVIAAVRAWRCASAGWTRRALAVAALALLAGTATFGAIVATTGAPATEQDFHLAVASALWVVVVSLATPGAPSRIAIGDASAAVTATGAAGQG